MFKRAPLRPPCDDWLPAGHRWHLDPVLESCGSRAFSSLSSLPIRVPAAECVPSDVVVPHAAVGQGPVIPLRNSQVVHA